MVKLKSTFFLVIIIFLSCTCNSNQKQGIKNEIIEQGDNEMSNNQSKKLNRYNFHFLTKGMSYNEIVEKIGEPDAPEGSGVIMFRYNLSDGAYLILNFGSPGKELIKATIIYANSKCEEIIQ